MKFKKSHLQGCVEIYPEIFNDERGSFVKTFHREAFHDQGLQVEWAEEYYSVSRKGVLRGLHFQLPPQDHAKLVFCNSGEIFDAVVDLRRGSATYGQHAVFHLNSVQRNLLYIPSGFAHGYYVESDTAIVSYCVQTVYSAEHDQGILWSSAGIEWPDSNPILSVRDRNHQSLIDFESPFSV